MIYLAFAILLVIFISFIIYKLILKPIKLKSHIAKSFRNGGYRIKEYTYNPIGAPIYD